MGLSIASGATAGRHLSRFPPSACHRRASSLSLGLYAALEVALTSLLCHAHRAHTTRATDGCAPRVSIPAWSMILCVQRWLQSIPTGLFYRKPSPMDQILGFFEASHPARHLLFAFLILVLGHWLIKFVTHWLERAMTRAQVEPTVTR